MVIKGILKKRKDSKKISEAMDGVIDCIEKSDYRNYGERLAELAEAYEDSGKLRHAVNFYELAAKYAPSSSRRERFLQYRQEAYDKLPDTAKKRDKLRKKGNLEKKVKSTAVVLITSVFLSILFFSSNITGFYVYELDKAASNLIGVLFFLIGLICLYFIIKNK